jgi:hypothetical protein
MAYVIYCTANKSILEKNPNQSIEEVLKIIKKDPHEYRHALLEHQENYNIAFEAIKKNYGIYNFIPEKLRNNYSITKLVIRKNGLYLNIIPKKFINKEIIDLAISNNSASIQYVPESFITNDMLEYVIHNNPYNIIRIPKKFITEELKLFTKKSFINIKTSINYSDIPEYFKEDIDIILKIAKGGYCDSIKDKLKIKDTSILILSVNPSLLKYVPNEFFNDFDYKMRLVVCNQKIVEFNKDPILNMLWYIEWNFEKYEKNYIEIIQNIKYLIYSINFYKLLTILLNDDDYRKIIIDHLHLFVELINNDEKLLLFFDHNNILFYELKMLIPETLLENEDEDKYEQQKEYIKKKFPNKYIYFF